VSDSHADRSLLVCPSAPTKLYPAWPRLAPCSVTLADPVAAMLALLVALTMLASCDIPALMLPCLAPALIATRRVPITSCPAWHRIDVSASHVVRSHPVSPSLVHPVYAAGPSPDPCTVTLDDPVAAPFVRRATLATSGSNDNPALTLPTRWPVVSETRWLPPTLSPPRHRTDVSDSQDVCSHALTPDLTHGVCDVCPKPAPCTVTLADPLPARFACLAWLIPIVSIENDRVRHPPCRPAVSIARWLPATPPPALHLTDVSDSRVDRSHPVLHILAAAVYDSAPILPPCTVMLDAPVAAPLVDATALNEPCSPVKTCVADLMRTPTLSDARLLPIIPCPP
jgi:hypothetical protein